MHIDIDPNGAGQSENIDKKDRHDEDEEAEGGVGAHAHAPVEGGDKADTKEARKDVGNKHGADVKAGFGHKILIAMVTAVLHVKGFVEGEGTGLKHICLMTTGTFEVENTVQLTAFVKKRHF